MSRRTHDSEPFPRGRRASLRPGGRPAADDAGPGPRATPARASVSLDPIHWGPNTFTGARRLLEAIARQDAQRINDEVSRIGEEDVQEVVGVLLQALWHSVIFASDASTSRALVRFCLDQMEGRTP